MADQSQEGVASTSTFVNPTTPAQGRRLAADRRDGLVAVLRLLDVAAVVLAALIAYLVREGRLPDGRLYWYEIAFMAVLAASVFEHAGLYAPSRLGRLDASPKLAVAWGLVAAALLSADYYLKLSSEISRIWSAATFLTGLVLLSAVRLVAVRWIEEQRAAGWFAASVAVIGPRDAARKLAERLSPRFGRDATLAGVFEIDPARRDGGDGIDQLLALGRRRPLDEILVALPPGADLGPAVRRLMSLPFNVRLVPDESPAGVPVVEVSSVLGLPSLTVARPPLSALQRAIKRAEDVTLSLGSLVVFGPLMLLIALAVRLERSGPVLFRQERWGFNGQRFTVLKFRTMRPDAALDAGVPQARRGDPRVTKLGRLLRRTSLDELPQIFNVLKGDMSLVGPRPHASAHNELYAKRIDNYLARHRLKPGITGLAQIRGLRGETPTLDLMQRRVKYDLLYIDGWSLLLDIKILFLTIFTGFTHPKAW